MLQHQQRVNRLVYTCARYLKIIPQEVIEKDYGCGDPSRWVKPGDTMLNLGSRFVIPAFAGGSFL